MLEDALDEHAESMSARKTGARKEETCLITENAYDR